MNKLVIFTMISPSLFPYLSVPKPDAELTLQELWADLILIRLSLQLEEKSNLGSWSVALFDPDYLVV